MACEDCSNYQPMSAEDGYCDRKGIVVSFYDGCGLIYDDDFDDEDNSDDEDNVSISNLFELRSVEQRDFINYNSITFLKTIELMKKYTLCSFCYQDWVDPSEYDEDEYYEAALDICNRLYGYTGVREDEEFVPIVEDIIDFWYGDATKDDEKLKEKIKNFTNELVDEYRKM